MTFWKLRVYQAAQQLVKEVERLHALIPKGFSDLWNQLSRCSASVLLNIGEGAATFRAGRKAYFYEIARGSAGETQAALWALVEKGALRVADIRYADQLARSIVRMLTRMIRNLEKQA